MMIRPAKITDTARPNLSFRSLHKPTDKEKLALYLMKKLGYSATKAGRVAGI